MQNGAGGPIYSTVDRSCKLLHLESFFLPTTRKKTSAYSCLLILPSGKRI